MRMPIGKYTIGAAVSCSVSYKDKISPEELAAILSGKEPIGEWVIHIGAVFNEIPHDYLTGIMDELNIPLETVKDVFHALPPVLQGSHFKELISRSKGGLEKPQSMAR